MALKGRDFSRTVKTPPKSGFRLCVRISAAQRRKNAAHSLP